MDGVGFVLIVKILKTKEGLKVIIIDMKDIKNRLTSRKLWLTLGGISGLLLVGVTGQMEWELVMDKLVILILGYVGVEGSNDIIKTFKK